MARDRDPGASFPNQDRGSRNACFRLAIAFLGDGRRRRQDLSSEPVCLSPVAPRDRATSSIGINAAGNLALGRLGDRSGKERTVRVGQITELAALIVLALALWQDARIMLVAALCVFAFGQAYIPNLKALASAVAPELRGRSLAWNNAAMYGG
ncbi:MAG TPA: MFS transporter, partial [Stellaceae bacterium]|nr:MFS transporter [Stellaceae bacterium]